MLIVNFQDMGLDWQRCEESFTNMVDKFGRKAHPEKGQPFSSAYSKEAEGSEAGVQISWQ
jgi:hypothetical protein